MNIEKTYQTESSSSSDTYAIGEQLGRKCRGSEIIILKSDLGGGKTTFVKGLAAGLGSKSLVTSPTFTVEQVYDCKDGISLHHFDFYRLHEAGILLRELEEVIEDPKSIAAVEWGDIVSEVLPIEHIEIKLEHQAGSQDKRKISASYSEKFDYLFEASK